MNTFNNNKIIEEDIESIVKNNPKIWESLRSKNIFLTGGTGFFGTWLLESLLAANEHYNLNSHITLLVPNQKTHQDFLQAYNHLATDPAVKFHFGDIKNFEFPENKFSHIIHAAASSFSPKFEKKDIIDRFDTVVLGTRRLLEFASVCGTTNLLYLSSGVVYGKSQFLHSPILESEIAGPITTDLSLNQAWGTSKRAAEFLCSYYADAFNFNLKIARCFSFVGPRLPINENFAIGNFIKNSIQGDPINILGDGTPLRSYMYTSDLVVWLYTMLTSNDNNKVYNVGSESEISIMNLATLVAKIMEEQFGYKKIEVNVSKKPQPDVIPERYIPSTQLAQTSLGLTTKIDLKEAIKRTVQYYLK